MDTPLAVVILAAGKGSRMKSDLAKVLHSIAGEPMLGHIIKAAQHLKPTRLIVVTGHSAAHVEAYITDTFTGVDTVRQTEQLGTGHAVQQTEELLADFNGDVLVLYGDVLFASKERLEHLVKAHNNSANALTMLTATTEDCTGLGRIIRDKNGAYTGIVEHKDCTPDQLKVTEVNLGTFMLDKTLMFTLLKHVKNSNAQGEYYLTDIISLAIADGHGVEAIPFPAARALMGVNNRIELSQAEAYFQNIIRHQHMANGVTLADPSSVFFTTDTHIENDVTIEPNVIFGPHVHIGKGCTIKAFSHIEGATMAENCTIGPFARVRPGSEFAADVNIGNFVETKKATLAKGAKVKHLSYMGDVSLGENTNTGAGTILANYDHHKKLKHISTIGANVAIGANSVIVSPVTIGDNVKIGACTVVRNNIDDDTLVAAKTDLIQKRITS